MYVGLSTVLLAGALINASNWSYQCNTVERPLSTPLDRFDINNDGTLTDFESGLTWMRCALGQQWSGDTCVGRAQSYTWQAAQQQVMALNQHGGYADHADWRMPKLPELASIIERQCAYPRINISLFPNTQPVFFWSANAKPGSESLGYALSFGPEGVSVMNRETLSHVRLVRGRD